MEYLYWQVTREIQIINACVTTRDRIALKSFIYGVRSDQEGSLPTEDVTSFKETLTVILDVGTDAHPDTPASR